MGNPLSRTKPKAPKKVRFNLVFENIIENQAIVLDNIYDITDNNMQANVYKRVKSLKRKHPDYLEGESIVDKDLEPLAAKKLSFSLKNEDEIPSASEVNLEAKDSSLKSISFDENNNTIENKCFKTKIDGMIFLI